MKTLSPLALAAILFTGVPAHAYMGGGIPSSFGAVSDGYGNVIQPFDYSDAVQSAFWNCD